jgi:hypothetical protein
MVAHRRLRDRDVREFRQDAAIETSRRVPLFARRLTIRRANTVMNAATWSSFGLLRSG